MYDRETLKIGPSETKLLETGVIYGKYIWWIASYSLTDQDPNDWWNKVRRVLMWNGFNLKMYIQPPLDNIKASEYEDEIIWKALEDMYWKDKVRSEQEVLKVWNAVRQELRHDILDAEGIEYDESLFE